MKKDKIKKKLLVRKIFDHSCVGKYEAPVTEKQNLLDSDSSNIHIFFQIFLLNGYDAIFELGYKKRKQKL